MRTKFPSVDLCAEYECFCDYWHAKAGSNAVKVDWDATWRNWIRRAAERASTANGRLTRTELATSEKNFIKAQALKARMSGNTRKELHQ